MRIGKAEGNERAGLLLADAGDYLKRGAVLAKGFSRTRQSGESTAQVGVKAGKARVALFAPVTK
jgi:hypothetical protein